MGESFEKRLGKIPKRKWEETGPQSVIAAMGTSILADSYYNDPVEAQWRAGTSVADSITQNICQALASYKEKPKTNQKNIFKDTVPDIEDQSLPKELIAMFQPLFCKLCNAQLSSNVMAKLHYKSKNHEKKIRKFLIEYSERTGEPLHKRAKVGASVKTEEDQNPRWFHCEICDLPLTGKMHAESHYMGKNHQKVMMGHSLPTGKGYYNADGKWVRQAPAKKVVSPEGEDSFGLSFRKTVPETVSAPSTSTVPAKQEEFRCEVCNVTATCKEQIDMHFNGQKHQKKLKHLGLGLPSAPEDTPVAAKQMDMNLSVYRTPSGGFYCPTCNISLNSEEQFKTHLKSKGHLKKWSQKQK